MTGRHDQKSLHPHLQGEQPQPLRRPPALHVGDRVALISPSSHQGEASPNLRKSAVAILSGWGLEVRNGAEEEAQHLYFAGDDAHRAAQFEKLYCDPELKALFITRGGYGASRILPLLDGGRLAAAPAKAVVGFSDATALFAFLHAVVGISVVHGPCIAAAGFLNAPPMKEELEALRRALFEPQNPPEFPIQPLHGTFRGGTPPAGTVIQGTVADGTVVQDAVVQGPVVGGSLAVLVTTLGTPWEIDTRGALLFLEDVNEAPYRIDRMVTHLRAAEKLDGIRGVLLGHFQDCDGEPSGLLDEVLLDLFGHAPYPVARGLAAGHGTPNLAFPLGQAAAMTTAGEGGARLTFF